MQRYDRSGEGRLSLDDFCILCERVAEAAVRGAADAAGSDGGAARSGGEKGGEKGGEVLSRLQLMALFAQADVTGAHAICASQWAWARGQLAALLQTTIKAHEQRAKALRVNEEKAREEAKARAAREAKPTRSESMQASAASHAASLTGGAAARRMSAGVDAELLTRLREQRSDAAAPAAADPAAAESRLLLTMAG
jgi:hypothetical protein